jgi:signal transduction histidine kinase
VVDAQAWRELAFVLLAFPFGLAWFVFLAAGLSFTVGAAFSVVGLPLLLVGLLAWRALAQLDRSLIASLLGVVISPPYRQPERSGLWAWLRARVGDGATWRDLVWVALRFPLGLLSALTVGPLLAAFVTLGGAVLGVLLGSAVGPGWWRIDTVPEAVLVLPLGLAAGLAAMWAAHWLARLHVAAACVLLAADRDPVLTARVEDLRTSRARVIAAADAERRRIERDLHDGAQQRLVALSLTLGMARGKLGSDPAQAQALVDEAHAEARAAVAELRDLARGIHPAVLTDRGLAAALAELATRSPVPVALDVPDPGRLPAAVESTAWFVASEALANVAKYAQADEAGVRLRLEDDTLVLEVTDDGVGGADPTGGSGLRGLVDRVGALDGRLILRSPPGRGTLVRAELPVR